MPDGDSDRSRAAERTDHGIHQENRGPHRAALPHSHRHVRHRRRAVLGTILSLLLYRSRLVPRPIAILGLIGYPTLMLGGILAAFDLTDLTQGVGQLWLVPGGLFELILPIWLFAKGFTFLGPAPSPAP
jgi:hypothetical protein